MTRTLNTTVAALAALAWLPSTSAAAAQETTAQEALEYLLRGEQVKGTSANAPAVRFLRHLDPDPSACRFHAEDRVPLPGGGFKNTCRFDPDPRTSAELDAFADRVAAVAADATLPDDVRREARFALANAASSENGEGTPYPRAFDLLVSVYEGGYDAALYTIWWTDSVRGPAYMRELFDRSERPPLCRWDYDSGRYEPPECVRGFQTFHDTPWCEAGRYLFKEEVAEAQERTPSERLVPAAGYPRPIPDGLPEHVEDWHRRCR